MVRHPPRHQKHRQTEQGKASQHGQGGLQQQPIEQVGGREVNQGWQSDQQRSFAEDSCPHAVAPSQDSKALVPIST